MDRGDLWMTQAIKLQDEVKQVKEMLVRRDEEIRQLKDANKELLEALHECEGIEEEEDSEF